MFVKERLKLAYRRHDVSWNKSSFWYPNFIHFGVLFVNGHVYVIMKTGYAAKMKREIEVIIPRARYSLFRY